MRGKPGGVVVLILWLTAVPAMPAGAEPSGPMVALDSYGGYTGLHLGNSSQYFRLAQAEGRWWLVTPEGNAFFSLGANSVNPWNDGYPSSYHANIRALYGGDYQELPWIEVTLNRLRSWGLNTLGGWSWVSIFEHDFPYAVLLDLSCTGNHPSCANAFRKVSQRFPDVFDPGFATSVYNTLHTWDQYSGWGLKETWLTDPYLIGYWTDNELWWWHESPVIVDLRAETVVEDFIEKDCSWYGKQAWVNYLREVYHNNIGSLNAAWGTSYGGFDQLCSVTSVPYTGAVNDKNGFLGRIAEKYFAITVNALRARDPNHLILGTRFAESAPEPVLPPAAICDAVGINYYIGVKPYELPVKFRDTVARWYELSGKPILVSEFSFESPDTGLPGTMGGAYGVNTRAERADGYRNFFHYAIESPNVIGLHWYKYVDEPVEGRADKENKGNGLVEEADAPYPELIEAVAESAHGAYDYLLDTGRAALPSPRLTLPRHSDNLQSADVIFHWQPVTGATSYNLQVSRYPTFPATGTSSFPGIAGNSYAHHLPHPGRWYWRAQAVGNDKRSVFSAPYPVNLLDVASVYMLNDFETAEEASVANDSNGWFGLWDSWPRGAIAIQQSATTGVTHGTYAGQAHYSGACLYTPCKAGLCRFPQGDGFFPHDWSAFDYLAYDVYNPNPNDWNAEITVSTPAGTGGYYLWDRYPIKGGVQNHFIFDLNKPFYAGLRTNITSLALELVDPLPDFSIYYDNVRLIDVRADTLRPDPVPFTARDTGLGEAVALDWSTYLPAPDVVSYRIYVGANGNCNIGPGRSTPIETVDGAVVNYTARMLVPPTATSGAISLQPDQTYCFVVTAVDWMGNESTAGQGQIATPTFAGYVYPALPAFYGRVTNSYGVPLPGAVIQASSSAQSISALTDKDGNYSIWPVTGNYRFQTSRAGYQDGQAIEDLEVEFDTRQHIDVVLRFPVDLVSNGDFEGAWQDQWTVIGEGGGLPLAQPDHVRSGQAALQLGGQATTGSSAVAQDLARSPICDGMVAFWYMVSDAGSQDLLEIGLGDDGEEQIFHRLLLANQAWTYGTFTLPGTFEGALRLILRLQKNSTSPTAVYIDEVSMINVHCVGAHSLYLPLISASKGP